MGFEPETAPQTRLLLYPLIQPQSTFSTIRINLESLTSFKGPLFRKPVLFWGTQYNKPAL